MSLYSAARLKIKTHARSAGRITIGRAPAYTIRYRPWHIRGAGRKVDVRRRSQAEQSVAVYRSVRQTLTL